MTHSRRHHRIAACALGAVAVFGAVLATSRIDVRRAPAPAPAPSGYDAGGRPLGDVVVPDERPNLVVILVDTLRADCVRPDLMPNLSRIATEGVSFRNACSTAPWTLPAAASLLTGLLPSNHGNLDQETPRLPASVTTFAEVLSESCGYETVACFGSSWFGDTGSLLQGFQETRKDFHLQGIDSFLASWARKRNPRRPFFLLLHTYEAHDPYGAPNHPWPLPFRPVGGTPNVPRDFEPWQHARTFFLDLEGREAFVRTLGPDYVQSVVRYLVRDHAEDPRPALVDEVRGAYRDGVRWVDGLLGRSVDRLREWGLLRGTLLVVASDHGEAFGEHGQLGHGHQLYDELVHVPIVMHGPAPFRGGARVAGSVSLMDVLPTFLDWIGVPPVEGIDAVSALPVIRGAPGRPVVAEELLTPVTMQIPIDASLASVRAPGWKYVATFDRGLGTLREEVYDLAADPAEMRDLLAAGGTGPALPPEVCRVVRETRQRLARSERVRPATDPPPAVHTQAVVDALEASPACE
jgi:arylsulfatase A-like enzyme